MQPALAILIGNIRLTRMQARALERRLEARTHEEAALAMKLKPPAFRWRFARAISRLPVQARNSYREMLPKRIRRRREAKLSSLSDCANV
jgi:hypothetical protein